ncbi:MAG: TetR/AcrR family transcriptional regulator [Tractidigestivibacter sp.]|jgi:AcrR family transcriptional regulator
MANPYLQALEPAGPKPLAPSQLALREALVELMDERGYEHVDVVALCSRAFVSRSTFYSHYHGVDELLQELETFHVANISRLSSPISKVSDAASNDLSFYEKTFDYVTDNRRAVRVLLSGSPGQRFATQWKTAIKMHLWDRSERRGTAVPSDFELEILSSAVIAGYAYYLDHPTRVSRDQVLNVVRSFLSALDNDLKTRL